MISRNLVFVAAALLFGAVSAGRAQDNSANTSGSQQAPSLGDAARKARADKKETSKPARVFTNDDVGDLKGTISVVGSGTASASAAASDVGKAQDKKGEAKKDSSKGESYWRGRFAAARKVLANDEKELDILQREYNLKLTQYSQDPTWAMHQQYSRDDINKTQGEIDAKKEAVAKDKQALSDLEDEMRKAGGEPGWANEASGANQSNSSSSQDGGSGGANSVTSDSASSAQP